MRTTLSIDEDVAEQLKEQMKESGKSFKDTVNDLIRLAIHTSRKPKNEEPFVIKPFNTGLLPGLNLENIEELLDQIDGPGRKW